MRIACHLILLVVGLVSLLSTTAHHLIHIVRWRRRDLGYVSEGHAVFGSLVLLLAGSTSTLGLVDGVVGALLTGSG